MKPCMIAVSTALVLSAARASAIDKPIELHPVPLKSANGIICEKKLREDESVRKDWDNLNSARVRIDALKGADTDEKKIQLLNTPQAANLGLDVSQTHQMDRSAALKYLKGRLQRDRETAAQIKSRFQTLDGCKQTLDLELSRTQAESDLLGAVTLPGASWDAAIASGLAQFLAQRANDEITLWLIDNISSQVRDKLRSYLPRTADIGLSTTYVTGLGALLASSLRQDLEDLPFALLAKTLELTPDDSKALRTLGTLARAIRGGASAPSVLAGLAYSKDLQTLCDHGSAVACWFGEIGMIAVHLRDVAEAANEARAKEDINNLTFPKLAEACKVKEAANIFCAKLVSRAEMCPENPTNACCLDLSKSLTTTLGAFFQIVTEVRQWQKSPPSDAAAVLARASDVLSSVESLFTGAAGFLPTKELRDGWNKAHAYFSAANELLRGNYAEGVRDALAQFGNLSSLNGFEKYVPLLVDLSQAKDAVTVRSVLETAAAPVGSWRLKRQDGLHITVTGLVGVAGGSETTFTSSYSAGAAGGLIGALGFDFAWPLDKAWTCGFLLSVLDVGQVITAPMFPAKNSQQTKPSVGGSFSIVQVLSPGAYLRVGMGNSPFTFGGGFAFAPNLRKYDQLALNDSVVSSQQLTVLRLQAFVGVDITVLPLN